MADQKFFFLVYLERLNAFLDERIEVNAMEGEYLSEYLECYNIDVVIE